MSSRMPPLQIEGLAYPRRWPLLAERHAPRCDGGAGVGDEADGRELLEDPTWVVGAGDVDEHGDQRPSELRSSKTTTPACSSS
jgi:hypothetical protein